MKKNLIFQKVLISTCLAFIVLGVVLLAPKPGGEGVNLLRTTSITARITTATAALQQMEPHQWIIGRGIFSKPVGSDLPSRNKTSSHARMPDNIIITLLSQTGVVGLFLAIISLQKWLRHFWKEKPYLAIALIALLVHSQINNTLLQPFVLLYFLSFLAI